MFGTDGVSASAAVEGVDGDVDVGDTSVALVVG